MSLGNNSGRFTYVNIKKGQLVVKKENEFSYFSFIAGYLKDLEIRDDEFNGKKYKKLCLMLTDNDEDFQLQMKLDSGYGIAFSMMVPNIDLKQMVKITPTYKEVDNKGKAGMFINQSGKALKWFWTRDNPGHLPPMEQTEFKGETLWDNTKQQTFLIDYLLNTIKPALGHSIVDGPAHQLDEKERDPNPSDITEPVDDLPF
ncbi:MAG: hypothetical protein ABIT05_01215 [Chitinophagaceae bacterium]